MSSKKIPGGLPQWLTRAEVAALFRVTTRTVDVMRADGRLTAYALGDRVIRFKRSDVEAAFQPIGAD
jgi:excisionase family DNA binding protein